MKSDPRLSTGRARLALFAAAIVIAPTIATAQNFQHVAPKLPPQPEAPAILAPPEKNAPSQDQTVLIPELKGIVFVGDVKLVRADSAGIEAPPNGMIAQNLPLLSDDGEFAGKVKAYIGHPLMRAGLDAIANMVRAIYRANERPFIDVSVPPQKVQNGVVQIVVTEYRVGKVNVSGNRYFSTPLIRSMSDLDSGEVLTLPVLRKQIDDLNQNPFLTVSAVLKPGQETGSSDVDLQASDQFPVRVYAGYDNQGVPTLGRSEWNVGINWGNAFELGQLLSYQFTRSIVGRYTSHSGSDVVPIDADDKILLFGAQAAQVPQIATDFNSRGNSAQISGRYVRDLPGNSWLKHNVEIGMDYKRTNNNLEFSGFDILDTAIDILQFPLIYNATATDTYGQTVLENDLIYSPGNLTNTNTDEAMQQLVPFSKANYLYDRFSITRTTFLPYNLTWIARGTVQGTTVNLPNSEQLGGGGIGSVRGYNPETALGSEGVLLSQELRLPAFSPLRVMGADIGVADQMQFGVFWDYASLNQSTPLPDLPRNATLASVGFNVHYNLERYLDVEFELGSQLRRAPDAADRGTLAAIVTTVSL